MLVGEAFAAKDREQAVAGGSVAEAEAFDVVAVELAAFEVGERFAAGGRIELLREVALRKEYSRLDQLVGSLQSTSNFLLQNFTL